MKKSIFGKIGAAAVVLTLVTSSLVGGTFAKYTSSVTATGTAAAAKWAIAFAKDGTNIEDDTPATKTFTLTDDNAAQVGAVAGKIAPGSYGTIDLSIDGKDSEVGYSYTITADVSQLGNVPIAFYLGSEAKPDQKLSATNGKILIDSGNVLQENVGTAVQKSLYWVWEETDGDTAAGIAATSGTIDLTLEATQYTKPAAQP